MIEVTDEMVQLAVKTFLDAPGTNIVEIDEAMRAALTAALAVHDQAHADCVQVRPLCGPVEDRLDQDDRPLLGADDQGDCAACGHLVVSHQYAGCAARLRRSYGLELCRCHLTRDQARTGTATSITDGGPR